MSLPFGQLEGQQRLRLDMPVRAGVGHHGRGAERAFPGVDLRGQRDLRAAVVAVQDAGFLHLGGVEPVAQRAAEIQLADATLGTVPWARPGPRRR